MGIRGIRQDLCRRQVGSTVWIENNTNSDQKGGLFGQDEQTACQLERDGVPRHIGTERFTLQCGINMDFFIEMVTLDVCVVGGVITLKTTYNGLCIGRGSTHLYHPWRSGFANEFVQEIMHKYATAHKWLGVQSRVD